MTNDSDAPDKLPPAALDEMMWNGWILEFDGSVHAARTVDLAVLPGPHRLLLRLNYAMTPEQERMGLIHMVQVALDEAQVESLAMELLDYRNKRRRPAPRIQ